jgi:hypothetical protein
MYDFRCYQKLLLEGTAVHFLARGGVPTAAGKQSPNNPVAIPPEVGLGSGRRPRPARLPRPRDRHGVLKTPHCIGVEWLFMAPPQVSVCSLLKTSIFIVLRGMEERRISHMK